MLSCFRFLLLVLVVSCSLHEDVFAQTIIDWIDSNGGDYGDATNWNPQNIPDSSAETARFNLNDTLSILHDTSRTVSDLIVSDGEVFFGRAVAPIGVATFTADDDILVEGGFLELASLGVSQTLQLVAGDQLSVAEGGVLNISDGHSVSTDSLRVGSKNFGNFGEVGRLTIDGAGSLLEVTGSVATGFGASSQTGELLMTNDAMANFAGNLHLSSSATTSVSSDVDILSGSDVTVSGVLNVVNGSNTNQTSNVLIDGSGTTFGVDGNVNLGIGASINQTVTFTVSNSASFMQNGTNSLTLGGAAEATNAATINVSSGGTLSTGSGGTTIQPTGTLNIQGGTYNATGGLDNSAGGSLNHTDGTLVIDDGAFLPGVTSYTIDSISGPTVRLINNGSLNLTSGLNVGSSGTGSLEIDSNSDVSTSTAIIGSSTGSNGTVSVSDGSVWLNSNSLLVGVFGQGTLDINDFGIVSTGSASIGGSSTSNGSLVVRDTDSTFESNLLGIGRGGSVLAQAGGILDIFGNSHINGASAVATVTGSGSQWNNSGDLVVGDTGQGSLNVEAAGKISASTVLIGESSGSTGMANVDGVGSSWTSSGNLTVGLGGNGTLNISNGGTVSASNNFIGSDPGSIGMASIDGPGSSWISTANLYVGGSSTLAGGAGTLAVQPGGLAQVDGTFKVWSSGTVSLNGGTLELNGLLDVDGTINFNSGLINVNDITQNLVASASGSTIGGWNLGSSFALGTNQTLDLAGNTRIDFGGQFALGGGTIVSPLLLLQTGGTLVNVADSSTVTSPVVALPGSTIQVAGGDLAIGDATVVNGFYSNGTVSVAGGSTLSLLDANDAAFDTGALVTLGDATAGELIAENGLTLDFGSNITGFGTVDTPNNAAMPLINNGNIIGDSLAEPVTLTGYVKGVGTCDNCNITGTDAPGFSPATVNRGSVSYNGTLEIELGGTSSGTFDQLNHILGAGIADLGGILDVDLISGFSPSAGDTFEIITAAAVLGSFDTEQLPTLAGGLQWSVDYQATSVSLLVALAGDFDFDGDVNGADFLAWQRQAGTAQELADWQMNYGAVPSIFAASHAVPEPTAAALLLMASTGWLTVMSWRRRVGPTRSGRPTGCISR